MGAALLAGPIGLAATKGREFARLLDRADGDTTLERLYSRWTIEDGVATATDVALATERNRVAARGALDFPERTFRDMEVAVINHDGCSLIRQRVRGDFDAPRVSDPNIINALLGAPLELLQRGLDLLPLPQEDCEVFYDGEVTPPDPDEEDEEDISELLEELD